MKLYWTPNFWFFVTLENQALFGVNFGKMEDKERKSEGTAT